MLRTFSGVSRFQSQLGYQLIEDVCAGVLSSHRLHCPLCSVVIAIFPCFSVPGPCVLETLMLNTLRVVPVAIKTDGEVEVYLHATCILIHGTRWRLLQWSASCCGHFTPQERDPIPGPGEVWQTDGSHPCLVIKPEASLFFD